MVVVVVAVVVLIISGGDDLCRRGSSGKGGSLRILLLLLAGRKEGWKEEAALGDVSDGGLEVGECLAAHEVEEDEGEDDGERGEVGARCNGDAEQSYVRFDGHERLHGADGWPGLPTIRRGIVDDIWAGR